MQKAALTLGARLATPAERRQSVIAWSILFLGIVLSSALAFGAHRQLEREALQQFKADARDLLKRIETEIGAYEEVLVGLRAFFGSKENVSHAEFRRYVDGLDIRRRFPGFQNLNYAQLVRHDELRRFERAVRADTSLHAEGYPNFAVRSTGSRPEYLVITFIEPREFNPKLLGVDISANPGREWALSRARDTGQVTASGRPIRIEGPNAHVGLAMRLAVYQGGSVPGDVEARRARYKGSVGAGYRIRDLIGGVFDARQLGHLGFRLFDRGSEGEAPATRDEEQLLFDSVELADPDAMAPRQSKASYEERLRFPVAGRLWEVQVTASEHPAGAIATALPPLVLIGGLTTTLLLFGLFLSFANSRRRAEALAAEMTSDLTESERSLAEAQRLARLGSWSVDPASRRLDWSEEALRVLGLMQADAPRIVSELIARVHADDQASLQSKIAAAFHSQDGFENEHRFIGSDGIERWVHMIMQPIPEGAAGGTTLRGTVMDVTERKVVDRKNELEVVLSRLLAMTRATAGTLNDVLQVAAQMYGWNAARLWERRDNGRALHRSASHGEVADGLDVRFEAELLQALTGKTAWSKPLIQDRAPIWVGAACGSEEHLHALLDAQGRCALLLPIVTDGETSSVLAFFASGAVCGEQAALHAMQLVSTQLGHFLQRRRAEEHLLYVASHDALTGLPNRRLFNQSLQEGIARAAAAGHGVAVLYLDLDRFKNINDALGHGVGDEVLRGCARRFAGTVRETDLVAHISGDEFLVLLDRCSEHNAAIAVARKLIDAVARPLTVNGQELTITASVGVAIYPEDGTDAESLVKHADAALYRAKEQGRNTFQLYSANMDSQSMQRLAMETKLRRALERGELLLHYQPKVGIRTRQVAGVEALVRWQHPDLGLVSPAQFIPIAEETGLIVPIGAWVLREACEQAQRWRSEGLPGIRVAVNLSARQFRDPALCRQIGRLLDEVGIDPRLLELEITESMVMDEPTQAVAMLEDLKAMGLHLAIDDFGTGYSSLAYLKRFPIDCVKIDRSFVMGIPADADDLAITEAVIALAHSLRLQVVAEGVETAEQLEWLKRFGCEEMQGYYVSKPLPADEAGRFLRSSFRKHKEDSGPRGRKRASAAA